MKFIEVALLSTAIGMVSAVSGNVSSQPQRSKRILTPALLSQCKVLSALDARARKEIARISLEKLKEAESKPDMAEKLKECDVAALRAAFEKFSADYDAVCNLKEESRIRSPFESGI